MDWVLRAPRFGADALILDLEDAVPLDQKQQARENVARALAEFGDASFGRFVRINAWRTGMTVLDVWETAVPGLDGVMLAKAEDVEDITALDLMLGDLEIARGLPPGHIEIIPLCETARAKYRHFELCEASERVRRAGGAGGAVPGADATRALNIRATSDEGNEEYLMNARSGLEARAAGVTQILGGMTSKISDLDLVRRLAQRAKALGATGSMSIHPSHVPIHNEVFSPSQEEILHAKEVMEAIADAVAHDRAAARLHDEMIDYAHVRTSIEILDQARSIGLDVGEVPDIPVT
jgi:citrate lyase subunit beta/citryl-CoA lyase